MMAFIHSWPGMIFCIAFWLWAEWLHHTNTKG